MAKPPLIEKGLVVRSKGGFTYLQEKTRSRRRFKTSLAVRKRMAIARKKIKIPIVQGTMIGAPIAQAVGEANSRDRMFTQRWFRFFGTHVVQNYTGYNMDSKKFDIRNAWGTGLLVGWKALRNVGLFKEVNQFLGRNRIPLLRA